MCWDPRSDYLQIIVWSQTLSLRERLACAYFLLSARINQLRMLWLGSPGHIIVVTLLVTWPPSPHFALPREPQFYREHQRANIQGTARDWYKPTVLIPFLVSHLPCTKGGRICDPLLDRRLHRSLLGGLWAKLLLSWWKVSMHLALSLPLPALTTDELQKPHYNHKATSTKRKGKRTENPEKILVPDGIIEQLNLWTSMRKISHFLIKPLELGCWYMHPKYIPNGYI